jgi:hypothetical protein
MLKVLEDDFARIPALLDRTPAAPDPDPEPAAASADVEAVQLGLF